MNQGNRNIVTDSIQSLHKAVLDAFYSLRKGGVIVSCSGDRYMFSIEFDGPLPDGGLYGEMAFVDKNPSAQAVAQQRRCTSTNLGEKFLAGETICYIETNEALFFELLKVYKRGASTQELIDLKSGLKLYNVRISK
jgi:hypothetical protein